MITAAKSDPEQNPQAESTIAEEPVAQPSTPPETSARRTDARGHSRRTNRYWWPVALLVALVGIVTIGTLLNRDRGARGPADEVAPSAIDQNAAPADPGRSP